MNQWPVPGLRLQNASFSQEAIKAPNAQWHSALFVWWKGEKIHATLAGGDQLLHPAVIQFKVSIHVVLVDGDVVISFVFIFIIVSIHAVLVDGDQDGPNSVHQNAVSIHAVLVDGDREITQKQVELFGDFAYLAPIAPKKIVSEEALPEPGRFRDVFLAVRRRREMFGSLPFAPQLCSGFFREYTQEYLADAAVPVVLFLIRLRPLIPFS